MPLALMTTTASAQQSTLASDAAAFGAREAASQMAMSPNGKRIVYVGPGPGRASIVYVAELESGQVKPILRASGDPEEISWCNFVGDERLVCRYSTTLRDTGMLVGFGRTISLNVDGTDGKALGQRSSSNDARIRQFDGSIVDWLPGEHDKILMTRDYVPEAGTSGGTKVVRREDGLGVVKVNVRTLAAEQVEKPNKSASGYMSDGQGNVRLMVIHEANRDGVLTGKTKYRFRAAGSREWQALADSTGEFTPLAIDATTDSLYALMPLKGRDALYRIKLDSSMAATLVASHPKVDIDNVIRAGEGRKIVGYSYTDDRPHAVYFDNEYKTLAAGLGKALPSQPLISFIGASADGQTLLMVASGDSDAGKYYAFDRTKRALAPIFPTRPQLDGKALASVKAITYAAADGTQIPAYLTLPPGSAGKHLPAVVLPHGGPSSRDEWGFDWLPQFLAARGYAVIQPNYRGSAGYGTDWMVDNGFKSWRTSIGDISAAAKWLGAQGIADPKRIAIVGWSYGGYAALQGAATDPSLYKAVVAIAPVTDLQALKQEAADYTIKNTQARFIGSGAHVTEGSPIRHASDIEPPVLLFHGDMDQNVDVAQSRRMADALRGAGRTAEFVEFKGLDHQLSDSNARQEMLTKIGALLDRTIGR